MQASGCSSVVMLGTALLVSVCVLRASLLMFFYTLGHLAAVLEWLGAVVCSCCTQVFPAACTITWDAQGPSSTASVSNLLFCCVRGSSTYAFASLRLVCERVYVCMHRVLGSEPPLWLDSQNPLEPQVRSMCGVVGPHTV
jgi:hypothetical protein